MRNIDFTSWQSLLTTLVGLALVTLIGMGIRLVVMMTIQQRRERLHELDVQRTAVQVILIENVLGRFAANDATQQIAQLDGIVDAEIQAEAAERIVDMRRVAREEHATFAEACRHPLMHVVEIAMHDRVVA